MEGNAIKRNSSIELLRIISMLMVVAYHFYAHGNFEYQSFSTNAILTQLLALGGRIGYDCFILITGYFMVKSIFNMDRVLKVVFQVFFYSILFLFIFSITGKATLSIKDVLYSVLPITYMSYSFATEYVILVILSPYINKFIFSIKKRKLLNLIIILFVFWSVIPTVLKGIMGFSSLGLFFLLYLIGAYIRIYPADWMNSKKINLIGYSIFFGLLAFSVLLFNFAGMKWPVLISKGLFFSGADQVPVILSSIFLFLIFKNIHLKYSKGINIIGASTFGVLLIHDNNFVRDFLWINVFKNETFANSPYLILYEIIVVLFVFFSCICIDIARQQFLEKPVFNLIKKIRLKVDHKQSKFYKYMDKWVSKI